MNEGLLSKDVWLSCITPRLHSVTDLVHLARTCKHLALLLKDQVNLARVQVLHLRWAHCYFRAQHSMLQAWCDKMNRALSDDFGRWRIQSNNARSRLSWCFVREKQARCPECGEALRKQNVKCFVSWISEKCLCCAMEIEYSFICNGSADEEETENKFEFHQRRASRHCRS